MSSATDDREEYVKIVRKASGTKEITEAARRLSNTSNPSCIIEMAKKISSSNMNINGELVGNAEIGVIEATRRLSGTRAAMKELEKVAIEIKPDDDEKAKRSFGLGDKEWHIFTPDQLFKELETKLEGLTSAEAASRLEKYGLNRITPPKTTHWFVKFLWNLVGGFQLMMWFGAILCYIVFGLTNGTDIQTLALGVVLIVVVFSTTIFQSIQEGKSDQVMAALKALSPSTVFVYRDGDLQQIDAEHLVPGDIVKVAGGEKVPADIRVITSSDLKV